MSEKSLERWCVDYIRKKYNPNYNACLVKFTSPAQRGVPDRILLANNTTICFIEFKDLGKKPTKLQEYWINYLKTLGFKVEICDNKEQFKKLCLDVFT